MSVWRKKPEEMPSGLGIAGAALACAARKELVREGLKILQKDQLVDRVGIWLEPDENSPSGMAFPGAFHGLVWDRAGTEACPREWSLLSLEPPFPEEPLVHGKPFEQDLADSLRNPVIGQLVGLRRALWLPVTDQIRVKGLILLGSKGGSLASSLELARSVAADLGRALEIDDRLRDERIQSAELAFVRRFFDASSGPPSTNTLLTLLLADCVRRCDNGEGPGAAFAVIGELQPPDQDCSTTASVNFRWRDGDDAWTRAVESDPFAKLWRRALETRQIVGSEPPATWSGASIARIVAFPLLAGGQLLGTLVAGLAGRATCIATLDRLELRARLASFVLERRNQAKEESRKPGDEHALLDLVGDSLLLLDPSGAIAAASRGVKELLRQKNQAAVLPSGQFAYLFCARDRERLRKWLQNALDSSGAVPNSGREASHGELQNGIKVRLLLAPGLPGQRVAVSLERERSSEQPAFHPKLLQTEKLAVLGQKVSAIAHELSNPLTSILGYAQRLLVSQDAGARSEQARQIYQEAERASSILRQLLLNAREAIPERRLVSLNQIAMHAIELQRLQTDENIRVELQLDPALPFVHGDPGQLQQVLINLLGNARHALEEQSPAGAVIQIRTKRLGDRRVLLEVEDSGPGIPQEIRDKVFDPFFTTKPAGVGTGLGLAIVMSVVRDHGGQVRVQSPPLGGALFQIEIPAASERQQEDALRPRLQEKASLPEAAQFPGAAISFADSFDASKGTRVLVVEDEPTVARLIADVLVDEGMQVDVLLDGREALERAGRESYDLVICDMKMPGLDGRRFYRWLARSGNPLRRRFLFVTGDVLAAQTREFLERNRLPHVAKPFRVEELTEKVRAVLQAPVREQPSAGTIRKSVARNG